MKPPKHTIQWLAPHLSDGEVQAIYEAVMGVIGPNSDDVGYRVDGDGDPADASEIENDLKDEQRVALSRLFGKETE